nr:hypothetical protein [uncultured Nitrososphaera sp.]
MVVAAGQTNPPQVSVNNFPVPQYCVKPEGRVVFSEASFNQTWTSGSVTGRFGVFLSGASSSVARDTSHFFGGDGSALMTTDTTAGNQSEVKLQLQNWFKGKVAFENKFIMDSVHVADLYDFGWEKRGTTDGKRARFRINVTGASGTDEIKYESSANTYTSLSPTAIIKRPVINNVSGDTWGWWRLVIDLTSEQYVSLDVSGLNALLHYDMSGIDLASISGLSANENLLFTIVTAGTNAATKMYTTDWVVSQL